ncbi:hypothetical protein ACCO45_004177 [Purpureocillium lilacinum]|uniref:Uncharacterized protein n=1 Tax=Purpureocillium lilacinum TaxID=33203 RepID=A0ACC4E4H9_PURLI
MAWHGIARRAKDPRHPLASTSSRPLDARISKAARTEHRRQRSGQRFVGLRPVDIINTCRAPNSAFFPRAGAANALGAGPRRAGGACPAEPHGWRAPSGAPNSRAISSERRGSLVPPALADGHFLLDRYGLSDQQWGGHGSRLRHGSKTRA